MWWLEGVAPQTRRKLPDWFWVLIAWYESGRSGLSTHALATIVNRPPKKILQEFKSVKKLLPKYNVVGMFFCHETQLPLLGAGCYTETGCLAKNIELLAKYPWPKYRGLGEGEGLHSGKVGMDGWSLRGLRAASRRTADDYGIKLRFRGCAKMAQK